MKATRKCKMLAAALLLSIMLAILGGVTAIAAETVEITNGCAENATRSTSEDYESSDSGETVNKPNSSTKGEDICDGVEVMNEPDGTTEDSEATVDSSDEVSDAYSNTLENVYKTVKEYATEIFSSLAFIGTVIVAFIYKKGLLPVITRATGAISSLVSKLRDENAAGQKSADDKLRLATDQLASLEGDISDISSALRSVTERLEGCETLEREQKHIAKVMIGQIDMLYAIFMSSALPQYRKDEVGERISAMKKELEGYETDEKKC